MRIFSYNTLVVRLDNSAIQLGIDCDGGLWEGAVHSWETILVTTSFNSSRIYSADPILLREAIWQTRIMGQIYRRHDSHTDISAGTVVFALRLSRFETYFMRATVHWLSSIFR